MSGNGVWKGSIPALYRELALEARKRDVSAEDARANRGWAHRRMENGLLFAMRYRPDIGPSRLEMRLARAATDDAQDEKLWASQVQAALKTLYMSELDGTVPCRMPTYEWYRAPLPPEDAVADKHVVRWIELRRGEVRPDVGLCAMCAKRGEYNEVAWFPSFDLEGQRCEDCARAKGEENET